MRNSKKKERERNGGVKVFLDLTIFLKAGNGFHNLLLAKGCNGNNQTSIKTDWNQSVSTGHQPGYTRSPRQNSLPMRKIIPPSFYFIVVNNLIFPPKAHGHI
jgi:hypothetical protein